MGLYIGLGILIAFVFFYIVGDNIEKKEIKEILTDIQKLEALYTDFVEQKISHHIINSSNGEIDVPTIHKEILIYLKPHIDSIINHMNRLNFSSVNIPNKSVRFNNVTSTAELLIIKKAKNEDKLLNLEQIEHFTKSVSDTVHSDLQERILRIP